MVIVAIYYFVNGLHGNTVLFSWNNRKCNARIICSFCIIRRLVSLVNGYGSNCFNSKVTKPIKAFILHLIRYAINTIRIKFSYRFR